MIMKFFLSENSNEEDFISVLAYIFQSNVHNVSPNDLESILSYTHQCLQGFYRINLVENIVRLLQQIESQKCIILDKYKINIHDHWSCRLIILSSMKNISSKTVNSDQGLCFLQQAIKTFIPHKFESCHLLRLIVSILNNVDNKLDPNVATELIIFSKLVAISPLFKTKQSSKQYSEEISKIALKHLTLSGLSNLKYLPIKGVPTSVLQFSFDCNNQVGLISKVVIKVIEMFANNIENREGGCLYKKLIENLDFDKMTDLVWPVFYQRFQQLDFEGEFFQSLLKYWIPLTVSQYKSQFHHFIQTTDISNTLKGFILLDTKRKSYLKTYNKQDIICIENLFAKASTLTLALQIVTCDGKGAPQEIDLYFVYRFIELADSLSTDHRKCLKKILKSVAKAAAETKANLYLDFLTNVHRFGLTLLKTDRMFVGAQILLDCPDESIQMEYIKNRLGDYEDDVEKAFLNSDGSEIFGKVVKKYVKNNDYFSGKVLRMYVEESKDILSIQAAERVSTVFQLAAHFNSEQKNDDIQVNVHSSLWILFEKYKTNKDITDVFEIALLLKGLAQFTEMRKEIVDDIFEVFYPASVEMLLNRDQSTVITTQVSGKLKYEKVLEELYCNICQLLRIHRHIYGKKCKDIMSLMVYVIQNSSMRRPSTLSGDLLREFSTDDLNMRISFSDSTDLLNYKIKLLDDTLLKLNSSSSVQSLTIRKNPETRLVLHSICASSRQKYFLSWTMTYLLDLLQDSKSENASLAAALHCTEALMSDNLFCEHTVEYAPRVIMACVQHFANRNWVVRNACVNLAKALIDRFLGVITGTNNRAKCVDDLFQIFPQIVAPFLRIITNTFLDDSALAVMLFFSESQSKNYPFFTEFSIAVREAFLSAFVNLVKNDAGVYGNFAVRAYVSLCLEYDIPHIIGHVVQFCIENFKIIRSKSTTRNFVLLVKELNDKYADYIKEELDKPKGHYEIHQYLQEFCRFFQHFDSRQFDCLLLKIRQEDQVVAQLYQVDDVNINYEVRLWLHNYIPYLAIHTDVNNWCKMLNSVLTQQTPAFIHVKVLSILIDKFAKNDGIGQYTSDVLLVLFSKVLIIDDDLLFCYYKVIGLLLDSLKNITMDINTIVSEVRSTYLSIKNIYKLFIYIVILSLAPTKAKSDEVFINSSMDVIENMDYSNEQLSEDVSTLLKYVYKNAETPRVRIRILNVSMKLLSDHGHWHFVSYITKSSTSTCVGALKQILDFKLLKTLIQDDTLICEFVKDVHRTTCFKPHNFVNSNATYYVEDSSSHVSGFCLNIVVNKFVQDFLFYRKGDGWRCFYDQLREEAGNKRIGL